MDQCYYVAKTKHKDNVWTLPASLMNRFHLREGSTVELKCGPLNTIVRIRGTTLSSPLPDLPFIGLSANALKYLFIPENSSFLIKKEGNNEFRLGPVIGILTFSSHIPGRLGYYRTFAKRNGKNGLVYVFSGKDLNKQKATINGYYYDCWQNTWKTGELPYPDAVVNRFYPDSNITSVIEGVIGPNRIFNKKTLINKIDFYMALKNDRILEKFIPKTEPFSGSSDLQRFLSKYKEVFLKPVGGMKGIGIIKVNKNVTGEALDCLYLNKGKTITHEICSIGEISKVLKRAAGRKRQYVIQQGISRMLYQGGPFSFRTWSMKNGSGRWIMPGMFAKVSPDDGFLTNFTAGAELVPLDRLIKDMLTRLPYNKDQLLKLLENLTLKTAKVLDKKFGPLGELGFDIVFDTTGKPWLIEANGNPGNIPVFIQHEYPAWRDLVFRYPMEYAVHLAGFHKPEGLN